MKKQPNNDINAVFIIMVTYPLNAPTPYNDKAYLNELDAYTDYQEAIDTCTINYGLKKLNISKR